MGADLARALRLGQPGGVLVAASITVLIIGVVATVAGVLSGGWSEHRQRAVRILVATGSVACGLFVLGAAWLSYLTDAWRAGHECPPLRSGAGQPIFGRWGESTACLYSDGFTRYSADYTGLDLFHSGWQLVALSLTTLVTMAFAAIVLAKAFRSSTDRHRIGADSAPADNRGLLQYGQR